MSPRSTLTATRTFCRLHPITFRRVQVLRQCSHVAAVCRPQVCPKVHRMSMRVVRKANLGKQRPRPAAGRSQRRMTRVGFGNESPACVRSRLQHARPRSCAQASEPSPFRALGRSPPQQKQKGGRPIRRRLGRRREGGPSRPVSRKVGGSCSCVSIECRLARLPTCGDARGAARRGASWARRSVRC